MLSRRTRLLIVPLVVGLSIAGSRGAAPLLAVSYPAGWNLVSGPSGSTLTGASGSLYTLGPGDTDYETVPASAPLVGCRGYWAYFPDGGSITFGPGSTSCSVTLQPGAWAMLGNPSDRAADIGGEDAALRYTPGGDYQTTTRLQPGQGAWVSAQGRVTVTVAAPAAAPPASAPSSSPMLNSYSELQAIALTASDLPDYALDTEQPADITGASAAYTATWRARGSSTRFFVFEAITAFPTVAAAHAAFLAAPAAVLASSQATDGHQDGAQGVGDEDVVLTFTQTASGVTAASFTEIFRRGTVLVIVGTVDLPGAGSVATVVQYARTIDGRILPGGGTSAAAASAP